MDKSILNHYLKYGMFTNPGLYNTYLKSLSDDIEEIGRLIRWSLIHRTTLEWENGGINTDLKFGDMKKVPWYRQAEDDNLPTTAAMLAELFRRDKRGFTMERKVQDKLILTCRFAAILMASILKAKGIPARVRAGFAGYWEGAEVSSDHWITQYWDKTEKRWITIDVDGSFHDVGFNLYDVPEGKFDFSADAWLNVRNGKVDGTRFWNAGGFEGLTAISLELFYDYHCLMNNEIIYLHHPSFINVQKFGKTGEEWLKEIDELAVLMQKPDDNFLILEKMWEHKREFRIMKGGLL